MGDFLRGLSNQKAQAATAPSPVSQQAIGIYPQDVTQAVGLGPMQSAMLGVTPPAQPDNPYTSVDPSQVLKDSQQPIEGVGDDWQPHHLTGLKAVANFFLGNAFGRGNDKRNLEEALQGFRKDPETAINRLRQVDPAFAVKFAQATDSMSADQALTSARKVRALNTGSEILGASLNSIMESNDPEKTYAKALPTLQKLAEAADIPPDMLPDKYDADTVGTLVASGINVYQQKRLKQYADTIQNTQDYRGKRLDQLERGLQHKVQHDTTMEDIARLRTDKQGRTVAMTQYGPGVISKDGKMMQVRGPDRKVHTYLNAGTKNGVTNWVPHEDADEAQAAATDEMEADDNSYEENEE